MLIRSTSLRNKDANVNIDTVRFSQLLSADFLLEPIPINTRNQATGQFIRLFS